MPEDVITIIVALMLVKLRMMEEVLAAIKKVKEIFNKGKPEDEKLKEEKKPA